MKNTIITIVVIIVLVIAGYYLYSGFASAPATDTTAPAGDTMTNNQPAAAGDALTAPSTTGTATSTPATTN